MNQNLTISENLYNRLLLESQSRGLKRIFAEHGEMPDSVELLREDRN